MEPKGFCLFVLQGKNVHCIADVRHFSCGQWRNFSFWSFTVGFIFHHSSYCLCITFILLGSPPGYSHRQAMDWKILRFLAAGCNLKRGMIHMWQPPKGAAERRRRKKGQNLEQHLCEGKIVCFWASFHNSLCQSLQTRSE